MSNLNHVRAMLINAATMVEQQEVTNTQRAIYLGNIHTQVHELTDIWSAACDHEEALIQELDILRNEEAELKVQIAELDARGADQELIGNALEEMHRQDLLLALSVSKAQQETEAAYNKMVWAKARLEKAQEVVTEKVDLTPSLGINPNRKANDLIETVYKVSNRNNVSRETFNTTLLDKEIKNLDRVISHKTRFAAHLALKGQK